jgi:D-cysteine desulfhydrase
MERRRDGRASLILSFSPSLTPVVSRPAACVVRWSFRGYHPPTMHAKEPKRIELAQLPTPVVELRNLARHLGVPRVLLKRDDLTGLELSGNKIRKLEYVAADALAHKATSLVTLGAAQSNHCRATAALGARLGLRVRLLLRSADPKPAREGNYFLDGIFGAVSSIHGLEEFNQQRQDMLDGAMDAERAAGYTPYFFPIGASYPMGCWGYVRCISELVDQLGRETPVDIFCATSSGGTHVGLMLGKALLKCDNWRVLGVPISDDVAYFQRDLRRLERETTAEFGLEIEEEQTPINLIDGYVGEGYAIPYPAAIEAITLLGRTEGLLFDPVYTGKAMAGMLGTIRNGGVRPGAVPVFIHTGGAFGLLARRDLFNL